jgi:hypothetical protein
MQFEFGRKLIPMLAVLLLLLHHSAMAQQKRYVEGVVVDGVNRQPLAYTGLVLLPGGTGTITNEAGYFKLELGVKDDSLSVQLIGYSQLRLALRSEQQFYEIALTPRVMQLGEVVVRAADETPLYHLFEKVRGRFGQDEASSKAYYELKSNISGQQSELVECFYQADMRGADISRLRLKAGRLAVQPVASRIFTNIESSLALSSMTNVRTNRYFPGSPLELSIRQLRRRYDLIQNGGYQTESGDSVTIIRFKPKSQPDKWFEGTAWIEVGSGYLLQMQLICRNASVHPFVALYANDRITDVDFTVNRTFKRRNTSIHTERIDFEYRIGYASRRGELYQAFTRAVLFCYDFDQAFELPTFTFQTGNLSDYILINAFPYHAEFWKAGRETRINDRYGENAAFFEHPASITNVELVNKVPLAGQALLETPYKTWSRQRLVYTPFQERPAPEPGKREVRVDDYHLQVHLFCDFNYLNDSLHWLTATLFDPYQSYFYLPMNNKARCFINMYFDIMELERRRLEGRLKKEANSVEAAKAIYQEVSREAAELSDRYFREVMIGNNRKGMQYWNDRLVAKLGIDNIALFNPFDDP